MKIKRDVIGVSPDYKQSHNQYNSIKSLISEWSSYWNTSSSI